MGEQEETLMEFGVRESNGREGCLKKREQLWGQKGRSKCEENTTARMHKEAIS